MTKKVKRPAETAPVPTNAEAASDMLAEIGSLQRDMALHQAALDEVVAAAKATTELAVSPAKLRIEALSRGLEIWATANRPALTDGGKTKTIVLSAGKLSWRSAAPSVTVRGAEVVMAAIKAAGLGRFLRTKVEINKEAMLAEPAVATAIAGVSIGSSGEAFVVEPVAMPLAPAVPA